MAAVMSHLDYRAAILWQIIYMIEADSRIDTLLWLAMLIFSETDKRFEQIF